MQSVIIAAVSINLLGPGLDVCPPAQENLDGLQVTFHSSHVDCGEPNLSETQRETELNKEKWDPNRIYMNACESNVSVQFSLEVHTYIQR